MKGYRFYEYTAIDCHAVPRRVTFSDELSIAATKVFAWYVLSSSPLPVRCVQTDNDPIFTPWCTVGLKTPLDRPGKLYPFILKRQRFAALHSLNPRGRRG